MYGHTHSAQVERLEVVETGQRRRWTAEERLRVRREQSAPLVAAIEARLREQRSRLSNSSSVAKPTDYMLKLWDKFARFLDDG